MCTVHWLQISSVSSVIQSTVSFPTEGQRRSHQCSLGSFLPVLSSYPSAARSVGRLWASVAMGHVDFGDSRGTSSLPWRPSASSSAKRRSPHRPSHQRPPRVPLLACARCRAVAANWSQETRSLLPVNAREATPLNPRVLAKIDRA